MDLVFHVLDMGLTNLTRLYDMRWLLTECGLGYEFVDGLVEQYIIFFVNWISSLLPHGLMDWDYTNWTIKSFIPKLSF